MAVGAFYGNLSVGTFDNRFCDCKAQTITAGFTRTGAVCTVETIEYMGKMCIRDRRGPFCFAKGEGRVNGKDVVKGELSFAIV